MVLKYGLEWLFLFNDSRNGLYRGHDDGVIYCSSYPHRVNNLTQKSKTGARFKNSTSSY